MLMPILIGSAAWTAIDVLAAAAAATSFQCLDGKFSMRSSSGCPVPPEYALFSGRRAIVRRRKETEAPGSGGKPALPRDGRAGELARLVVPYRLLDFLARVHHEGAVLHHGLVQGPAREQQEARALVARGDFDAIALGQHARGVRIEPRRLRADLQAAFEHVDEGVVTVRHRLAEAGARRELDVEVERVRREPARSEE